MKQKMRIKIQQASKDIFSNENILFIIYFSLSKVGLHVVKNCLTKKYQRNEENRKQQGFTNRCQIWCLISNEFNKTNLALFYH